MLKRYPFVTWSATLALVLCLPSLFAEQPQQVFRLSYPMAIESLDPHDVTSAVGSNVALNLFEGLTLFDAKGFKALPGVAERWEISQDGRVFTFHLRRDARWSDGTRVTAGDFVYAWTRALQPKTNSPYAYQLYPIRNAELFHRGKIKDAKRLGLRVIRNDLFEVTLHSPVPYFLELTMLHPFLPLPRKLIRQKGKQWTQPGAMVTNGAFTLQEVVPDKKLVLRKNPHYWQAAQVRLQQLEYLFIKESDVVMVLYETGALDFTGDTHLGAAHVRKYAESNEYNVVPWLATFFLRLNCRMEPYQRRAFRTALSLAIDREKIVASVNQGGESVAYSVVPRGLRDYVPQATARFDPVQARALLHELGFCVDAEKATTVAKRRNCRPLPAIEILTNVEGEEYLDALALIVQMWRQHLGLSLARVRTEPWSKYLAAMRAGNYEIARSGWVADYPDPSSFLKLWLREGGNNRTGWSHPQYEKLLQASEKELDPSKRMALLQQADAILAEELPVIPIYTLVKRYLLKPYVKGFYDNMLHRHDAKTVYIDSVGPGDPNR